MLSEGEKREARQQSIVWLMQETIRELGKCQFRDIAESLERRRAMQEKPCEPKKSEPETETQNNGNSSPPSCVDSSKPKRGNPVLRAFKETGVIPEGYYLDEKKRLRKGTPGESSCPKSATPTALISSDEPDDFDLLESMRYALSERAEKKSESPGVKACRAWLTKKPAEFMLKFNELEKEERDAAERGSAEAVILDDKDKKLGEEIDELLERCRS